MTVLLLAVFGGAAGHGQSIQSWPEADLSLTFKRINLLIPSLARFASNLPNPQFVATGAIGTVRLDRRWSLSAGYLFADLPPQSQVLQRSAPGRGETPVVGTVLTLIIDKGGAR